MSSDQENKPSSRLVRYQWPVVLTLGVALFLGAVGGSFYLYVQDRERYYNDRYFRLLNSQANDVSQRLENYRDVMYSAGAIGLSPRFLHKKEETKKSEKDVPYKLEFLPEVVDAKTKKVVPSRDLFSEVRPRCLGASLSDLADTIGKLLCQIPDFSNVYVSSLPFLAGSGVNPYQQGSPPGVSTVQEKVAKKEKSLPIPQDTRKDSINVGAKCWKPTEVRSAAQAVRNANPAFGVATLWRSSNSVFVVEALVPTLLVIKGECFYSRWAITAEVDGRNLFRQNFIDRSFDDLLLVDTKGDVLFQAGESGLQFNRANLLFAGNNIVGSDLGSELSKSSSAGQSIGKGADGLEFQIQVKRKDDATFLKKVPTRQEVTVGGKSMYVFALPLNLPGVDKEQATRDYNPEGKRSYILLGLVSKDKLRNETWRLSPSVLLIFLLIALLILLILPLLKLLSMGPQDQWSLRDLTLVVGAGIVGTGLLTLALVDAGAFRWAKEQVDDELKQFAGSMIGHTRDEISDALVQLAAFDKLRAAELKVDKNKNSKVSSDKEKSSCHEKKQSSSPPDARLNVLGMKEVPPSYRTFDSVFWVDCGGRLIDQWDARTKGNYFPPIVTNLSDRPYFADIIDRRYWHWHMHNTVTPFTLQPLFSRIDGSNNAVIAIRSEIGPSDKSDNAVVAGLESRFISLFEPIVSPGTGFAVINDSNGKVLFHSQGQRNLREKFFEETDHDIGLKALIASRAEGCEDGIYGGNSHRFCVSAFKDLPWALVVFKNMEPLRTANLEAVTVASVLYLIYTLAVLLIVIGGLTVYQLHHQSVPVWLWPSKDGHTQYVASALVTMGLLLVGMLSLWWLPPQYAFVTGVILLPIIGAFVTYTLLNRESPPTSFAKPNRINNYRQAYVLVFGTMLALCSVLPAAVCMTLSYESEQTFLLKAGALDLAKSFAKSVDQIKERYQYHDHDDGKKLIEDRIYGMSPKPLYNNPAMPWCMWGLDSLDRRDVHFSSSKDKDKDTWLKGMFLSSPDFSVCEEKGSLKEIDSLVTDEEDWFEETYRFLRVAYNDEFTRTQGLFSKSQKPEKSEKSEDVQSEDVRWYVYKEAMKIVSYRPVHDLKPLDNSEGSARWNVAFTPRPWLTRLLSIILLVCAISGVLLAWRKPLTTSGTISSFRVLAIGIAIMSITILIWPGETLLVISVLLLLLFFAWLIYMLPGFIARRVLLLDLVPLEVNRSVYVNTFRESSEFATFTEDEKIAFEKEFGVSEGLNGIGKVILVNGWKRKRFQSEFTFQHTGVDNNAVALFACDEARSHYEAVWTEMSTEEKMALLHLARNGFLLKDHPGLISLFKKGWILCSPQLRYVNESFRQFVLSRKEEVIMLQGQLAGGIWAQLGRPLGVGMVFILAGLMYTQQELLTGITASVGVLAGLVPVISKVFDLFKSQKASSSAS